MCLGGECKAVDAGSKIEVRSMGEQELGGSWGAASCANRMWPPD